MYDGCSNDHHSSSSGSSLDGTAAELPPLDFVHKVDYLDSAIPPRIQKGFSTLENVFTCLYATTNYLIVGSNVGVTYMYDRRTAEIHRLRLEGSTHPIICVSCLETVDVMVAMGTSAGLIVVFQIPFRTNTASGESPRIEDDPSLIKRYLVTELHRRTIQSLVWSRNGMKLFSGDVEGNVVVTEMDYGLQQCSSSIFLREGDPIIQLDYKQKMLLVSTTRRVLCACTKADDATDRESGSCVSSVQIGQKPRKILGNFGACFYAPVSLRGEMVVFASRPSLRLWKADVNGKVLETFIFKDNPSSPTCKMMNIHAENVSDSAATIRTDFQFGRIQLYGDRHLLVWSDRQLCVICVDDLRMVARCDDVGPIVSVAICSSNEVFVLNGPRSVYRIANCADPSQTVTSRSLSKNVVVTSNFIPASLMKDLESKLRDSKLTSTLFTKLKQTIKVRPSKTSSANPTYELKPQSDPQNMYLTNADQNTTESDEVVPLQEESPEASVLVNDNNNVSVPAYDMKEMYAVLPDIAAEDDDGSLGIVFESKQRKQKKKMSVVSLDRNHAVNSSTFPEASPNEFDCNHVTATVTTRAEKEELLAKMLDLEALCPSRPVAEPVNGISRATDSDLVLFGSNAEPVDFEKIVEDIVEDEMATARRRPVSIPSRIASTKSASIDYEDIYTIGMQDTSLDASLNSNQDSYLSYGPPSGSSTLPSLTGDPPKTVVLSLPPTKVEETPMSFPVTADPLLVLDNTEPCLPPKDDDIVNLNMPQNLNLDACSDPRFTDHWVQHKCPKNILSLAVCEQYVVCTDHAEFVYYSSLDSMGLDWHKLEYQAKQVAISPTGNRVWRIHRGSAFALSNPSSNSPVGSKWIEAALGVSYVSVDDDCVWLVTHDGRLLVNCELEDNRCCGKIEAVPCPWQVAQVSCSSRIVWILTADAKVACRVGVSIEQPIGMKWSLVDFKGGSIFAMSLGTHSVGWIVDAAYDVWFKKGLTPKAAPKGIDKKWWQVKVSDYVFQPSSMLRTLTAALRERRFHPEQLVNLLGTNASGNLCLTACRGRGVWYYNPNDGRLLANSGQVVGHHWHAIDLTKRVPGKLKLMSASGVYHNHGGVWMWPERSQSICYFNPLSMSVQTCRLPEPIRENKPLCLSAAPGTVWLLLESGGIYIRRGIGAHHPLGTDWVPLDITQIAEHRLVHVSCGPDVVWACDSQGGVLMRIGTVEAPVTSCLPPAWIPVIDECSATHALPFFVKVYVGSTSTIVWAIDVNRNIYVREGIFSDLLIGVGWVLVSGIRAISLAISELAVYALMPSGAIYRRFNITRSNYIGDYWRELPGQANLLSVSAHDYLWAVGKDDQLLRHLSQVVTESTIMASRRCLRKSTSHSITEDEWEIVNAS